MFVGETQKSVQAPAHCQPPARTFSRIVIPFLLRRHSLSYAVILTRRVRISVDDYQACSGDCFKSAEGASYTSMGRSPMDDRTNRIRGPKARSILSGNEQAARQRPSIGPAGASLRIIYGDSSPSAALRVRMTTHSQQLATDN